MESQEKKHKRELYEIERKFIISKDQLKKDMEARLLQLSTEFHDATELRIAATTHRVIRENIAINNELDVLLSSQQRLYNENNLIKKRDRTLRQESELHEEEKRKALAKVKVQIKIIDRLTEDHKFMQQQIEKYKTYEQEIHASRREKRANDQRITLLEHEKKILEQNLHNVRCDRTSIQTDYLYLKEENDRLSEILMEAVSCIKEALTVRTESDQSLKAYKRENLLNSLFTLLSKAKDEKIRRPSLETVDCMEETYARGDLGFIPKPVELRSEVKAYKNMESQTGVSFDEYCVTGKIGPYKPVFSEEGEEEEVEEESVVVEEEEAESVLFFDEHEMALEESGGSQEFEGLMETEEASVPQAPSRLSGATSSTFDPTPSKH